LRRFPALYRMPVVYLASLIAAGTLVASRGVSMRTELSRGGDSAPSQMVSALREAVADTPSPVPAETDAILRSADGLRRKVVVRELEVVPRKTPDGPASGHALDYFAIRYVYGETPTMFQVGSRSGVPEGWIPRSAVLEWDSRMLARPTPRASRPTLVIYAEESCLAAALANRACPRHAGRCPTQGEESAVDGPESFLGWPILGLKSVPGSDGSPRTMYEVASLVADRAPPAPAASSVGTLQPGLRQVYIAFAIDTTSSMGATIDAARKLASDLAAEVSRRYQDVTLHLALVEYRDNSSRFGFKARLVTPFTQPDGFRAFLKSLAAASSGDGSVDESVLDGVALALPGSEGGINWPGGRSGELATKLLVLLGDAPDHDRGLDRTKALAARAKAAGISIAAVKLKSATPLSRDESARYDAQWLALAEGSYRPRDRKSGFNDPVPPLLIRVNESSALAPRLQALIDDRVEYARELAALAAAQEEGRLHQYVNSQGLTLEQVAPVLVDLHRGETNPKSLPDPRLNGTKAPSIRRGWLAERMGDARQVTVEILMTRAELDALIGELAGLQRAASGTASDLEALLAIGNAAAMGETSFLAADRGSQTFADHLRRRRGLPPARKDSLLNRSQTDLLRADSLDRAALIARLQAALVGLTKRRNAPDWSDPRRTVEGMATVPYDLIDF
jgi:hypothetical protein